MVETIVQIVQSVGFPIAMCIAMGGYVKYTEDKSRDERLEMQAQHAEEMGAIKDALINNTRAVEELTTTMKKEEVE